MGVKVREKVRGSGTWWLFIDHKGQRKAVKVGSKESATAKAKEIEAALTLGKLDLNPPETPPPVLFGEYAERWMAGHVEISLKHATKISYREALDRNILPVFENRPLQEITRTEIKEFAHGKVRHTADRRTEAQSATLSPVPHGVADRLAAGGTPRPPMAGH